MPHFRSVVRVNLSALGVPRIALAGLVTVFAWSAAAAQVGTIHVDIHQAEAQTKGDDACFGPWCNEQDFWVQVAFPPTFTWIKSNEIGNRDVASWAPAFAQSETVSKLQRFHDIQVELWDKDDTTADDRFDISPLAPDTLMVHFDACSNTWQQVGLTDKYGPGISHPPYGTRDPEFNGRVVLDVYTDGRVPFTTNDISIVGLNPVQSSFDPDSVVSLKPTSMRIQIASTYTGATPAPAPITVNVTDGISNWTETRNLIIPPGLSTFYFFDGMVAGSHPFLPFKPPNVDRASITYSAHVTYNDVAPQGTPSEFVDCYQSNNSIANKQNPIVRTSSPTIVYFPFDYLDAALYAPPFSEVQATQQRDEPFRQAIWPVAGVSDVVSGLPILPVYDPLILGWFSEPYLTLNNISVVFGLLGIDRGVLVPPKNWFADNSGRSVGWPGQAIGLSLGEFAPHAVLVEAGYYGVSTHELGHTYKLSQHKCSNGGLAEDWFGLGCRDEYSDHFTPSDGAPFVAQGLDVTGTIFPAGSADTSIGCAAPQAGTREVCQRNIMDVQSGTGYINWLDTFTWDYMAETLKQGNDPELVSLSGFVHSTNGFDPGQAPLFEGRLDFSYHSFGTPDLPDAVSSSPAGGPPLVSGEGQFMVHLATASGDKMYRFNPSFMSEGESAPRDGAYFSFMVPWDPTTTSVSLTAPADARDTDCEDGSCHDFVLFSRPIHGGPPSVTALRAGLDAPPPLTGATPAPPTIGPGHNAVLAWSADDPTPGSEGLRSILLLSHIGTSGGPDQFLPYTISNPGSQMSIPHDAFAAMPGDYMGQVIVSNGLLSTPLTTGTLFHVCNYANGGAETCNGIDDNCDGLVDNAPLPGPEKVELNPQPFPPTAIPFDWVADPNAQSYDVVYGNLGGLAASHGNFTTATLGCLADDTAATSLAALPTPPIGQGYWFEVRGNNCTGAGTYDSGDSAQFGPRDPGINASPNSCSSTTTIPLAPVLSITKTHTGHFYLGQPDATYTLTVSNTGNGPTSGTVNVTDAPPVGMAVTSMSGTGWTCSAVGCARNDALAAGASYPDITVAVSLTSFTSSSEVNQAAVVGGGSPSATANDTTLIDYPLMVLLKSHTGNFYQGQTNATYRLSVQDQGFGPTLGTVTVTELVPAGLTLVSMAGTGWSCPAPPGNVCTRSDVLASTAFYPDITVTVNVASNAPSSIMNHATISGGGGIGTGGAFDPTTIDPAMAVLGITKTHTGIFTQGQQGATYTVTVSNTGNTPTSGTITVTETVPSGLVLVSMAGTGWTCPAAPGNTCSRSDALAPGASYPAITVTVNVLATATSPQVNQVSASIPGMPPATTTDSTTIDPGMPVLSVTKSHIGNFSQGQTNAKYTVVVSNTGPVPTIGPVQMMEMPPSGLTVVSMAGTGWTCDPVQCNRNDVLPPGASYPAITITVNVLATATNPQTNQVMLNGGGAPPANASDPTTIIPAGVPALTITKTHVGNFTQGQMNATYTLTVSNNVGAGTTTGAVTVQEMPPPGLTPVSMSGTGWTCSPASCNRSTALAPGASYPTITVTVNVLPTATSPQVNQAGVTGGGSSPSTASDSTVIVPAGG